MSVGTMLAPLPSPDALILVVGTVKTVARVGDRLRRLELAAPVEQRADLAGMVGLDREQTGSRLQDGLVGDQWRGALVGGHTDILEMNAARRKLVSLANASKRWLGPIKPAARAATLNE